ncbi:TPA: type 1 fimbrial protein [Providencia stuartii]|nr:type 1 fimbrial protein [Providencia stuartii]
MTTKKILRIVLLSYFGLTINHAYSYDVLVNITGAVKASTCDLSSNQTKNINLGDIYLSSTGLGGSVGSTSPKADWSISLKCPSNIPVIFIPKGNSYSGQSSVLALDAVDGVATGVGVETEYSMDKNNWKALTLNVRNEIINSVKSEGDIHIFMRGYYKQINEKVTPGFANVSMTIDIVYQ